MQNLDTFYRDDIRLRDELFVPAGRAKTSFVDVRDIGAVASLVLSEEGHLNRAYTLTGSQALDYYEVAEIFSQVQGRPIRYARPTPSQYAARHRAKGVPEEFITVMRSLYWTVRLGIGAKVTPELGQLLGRASINMRQYAADFAERFAPGSAAERAAARPLQSGARGKMLLPLAELLR
jgi:hypothetical protein